MQFERAPKDESEIYNYQWIQLSNNKFINGILGGTLDLAWESDQQSFPICNINFPDHVICVPQFEFKISQTEIENNACARSCKEKLQLWKTWKSKMLPWRRYMLEISSTQHATQWKRLINYK